MTDFPAGKDALVTHSQRCASGSASLSTWSALIASRLISG